MAKIELTANQIQETLDKIYGQVLKGLPKTKNCYELADEYLSKYRRTEDACDDFIKYQILKCTTSGFVTSLGGFITLPIAIPANLASVWYIQLRMLATIAIMGGLNPDDDAVQTLCYVCLVGGSASKLLKNAGIQFGNKLALAGIKKIPGKILTKINQKVGFRFVTKFGTRGIVNLGKLIPLVGGVIGGSIDLIETKIMAKKAKEMFLHSNIID